MTGRKLHKKHFNKPEIDKLAKEDARFKNWPVVYVLDGERGAKRSAYVGETSSAASRLKQHLEGRGKADLQKVRVIVDDTFNKSACLDLESHLIRWLHGDGRLTVLNLNAGQTDAQYYDRAKYRDDFAKIFEDLRADGLFDGDIQEIENSDLFKLSPYKALTTDQNVAVENILDGLFHDLERPAGHTTAIVDGGPGTGKTIVAIYLMKLVADIRDFDPERDLLPDSLFAEYFTAENRKLLSNFRMALVIPQQSLRKSVSEVFKKTPGLHAGMVLNPFQVGESKDNFDLVIVDEAHRLNQRANQASGPLNKKFEAINIDLFGADDPRYTQLDWIKAKSTHQLLLVDALQAVRPHDLSPAQLTAELRAAKNAHRHYNLMTQLRVKAGSNYVGFIRALLRGDKPDPQDFGEYDLRFFDNVADMRREIRARDAEHGLARMLAGYAWPWVSKKDPTAFDIDLDGERMKWNTNAVDWSNSATALEEVGSIHVIQGYDLNYAGVIIGPDLQFDPATGQTVASRENYADKKGREKTGHLSATFDDDSLTTFIRNIYGVLLTRGIRGTYVYVCDPALREHIRAALP